MKAVAAALKAFPNFNASLDKGSRIDFETIFSYWGGCGYAQWISGACGSRCRSKRIVSIGKRIRRNQ